MALSAGTHIEVRTGGSDTICGGGFDPTQTAGMFTDGAATSANTSAPVFTSASYSFVAGDVDAYVFIGAGTNWTRGWYKIVSVNAGAATLSATAGGYQPYAGSTNTSAGCASVASPTGATWSIDYSQQNAAEFSGTDGTAAGAGSTLSSATIGFGSQMVGNVVRITAGTNATTGHHVITSVAAGVATFNNAVTTGVTSDVTMYLGGALASIGYAGAAHIAGNIIWIAYNASPYVTSSTSSNVTNGRFTGSNGSTTVTTYIHGYNTVRGDGPTGSGRPTLQWGVNGASNNLITQGQYFDIAHLIIDGVRGTYTGTGGIANTALGRVSYCKFMALSGPGVAFGDRTRTLFCEFTDLAGSTYNSGTNSVFVAGCYFHDNSTTTAFWQHGNAMITMVNCIFDTMTTPIVGGGLSRDNVTNCVFHNITGPGWNQSGAAEHIAFHGCVFSSCSTYGFASAGNYPGVTFDKCAFYNNTSGNVQNISPFNYEGSIYLTEDPFVDSAGGDFRLNLKAAGGALLRGAAFEFGGATWTNHRDIGAAQHTGRRHGDLDG